MQVQVPGYINLKPFKVWDHHPKCKYVKELGMLSLLISSSFTVSMDSEAQKVGSGL